MQLEGVKAQLTVASTVGERYWMATLLLIVIIVACIGIIYHRQMAVNDCLSSHTKSRDKIENLVEQKGANEEKKIHALTLKEQADQFLNRTFKDNDRLLKDVEDCRTLVQQLLQNATALAIEKESMTLKYQTCSEKLTTCSVKPS